MADVERWGMCELTLSGPREGNPYVDVRLSARFSYANRQVEVDGFYDGDGAYCIRFMPDETGTWRYVTSSNFPALDGIAGTFECVPANEGNHGPVRFRNPFHYAYEDGSPYFPVGTTCYAWTHQGDAMEEQTLATLASSPFNKIRMCVFPKHYRYNQNEPVYHPFMAASNGTWDWTRFNPPFWRHLEKRIGQLRDLGIQADLILFHPYDRWGYATMGAASDDRYLRYVVARLAAYRNVWWSMANEYDLMASKTLLDWDRFFRIVQERDPYGHPRSVHNCRGFYDHAKAWVTHQSIQHSDVARTREWREQYGKAALIDECQYEGDIPNRWGCISAQEMVHRFWEVTVRGGYCTHGETFLHPADVLWWAKGGVLHGESPARIAFLRRVLEVGPAEGLDPVDGVQASRFPCAGQPGRYYLTYFGVSQPRLAEFALPEGIGFRAEVLDTWGMSVTPVPGTLAGNVSIELPARPYMAIRLIRAS